MALTLTRENSWRPLRKKDEQEYLFQVEKAKSGRARCRRCSDFIAKDDLRFAIPIRDPRGEFGYISAWQHVACTRVDPAAATDDLKDKIHGLDGLSREDSSKVLSEVTSTEKPEHLHELNPDDLVKRGKIEPLKAPAAVLQHLLPFQEEGLRWMIEQESIDPEAAAAAEEATLAAEAKAKAERDEQLKKDGKVVPKIYQPARVPTRPCRGGILADEMGMGKTIQMISLIVANRGPGPTLVVAPVSSMMQWQEEIQTNVAAGELDVVVYHKTAQFTKEQLEVADVVLTTYPVLERAWRVLVNEGKVKCAYCAQLFIPRKLAIHNKYYCGPDAKRTAKLMKREKGDGDGDDAPKNRNKVQKKSTIKKGLKTLQVDVADSDIDSDDDEEDDEDTAAAATKKSKKNGGAKKGTAASKALAKGKSSKAAATGSKKAAPKTAVAGKKGAKVQPKKAKKRGGGADSSSSEWEEWQDTDDDDSDVELVDSDVEVVAPCSAASGTKKKPAAKPAGKPAAKKAAAKKATAAAAKPSPKTAAAAKKKAAAKASSKKKAEASDDDSSDADDEDTLVAPAPAKKGVVGPMGMYRELMAEAGRKARGRWEKARVKGVTSSDDSSDDDSSSSADDDDDDDSNDEDGTSDSDDSAAAKKKKSKDTNPIMCKDCGFQLAAHEFCPESGEKHPAPNLRPIPADDEDNGADVVDISQSVLHGVTWFRVILDEAHRIKGRTTSTARSAYALRADRKWCVTGTPLQNRVGDLYSLLRFMRLTPYARYYCQAPGCKCTTLSHPFSRDLLNWCVHCGHGPLQHYSYFNKHVMNPIVRYGYVGDGRKAMMLLSGDVLNRIMLRRTKTERAEDIKLPPCEISVISVELSEAERDFYTSLYKKSTARFDTFVEKGTLLHNYAHIFQLLSRLRQALDHPYLVLFSDSAYAAAAAASAIAAASPSSVAASTVKKEEDLAAVKVEGGAPVKAKRGRGGASAAVAVAPPVVKLEEGADAASTAAADDGPSEQDILRSAASTLGITLAALPAAAVNPSDVCHLCQESTCARTRFVVEPCKHGFHRLCLLEYIETLPEHPQPAAAPTAAEAKETAATAKGGRGKKAIVVQPGPSAPRCPRCFVPVALDLRRLAHVMDDAPEEEDDAPADDEDAESPAKAASKKGGSKKAAASPPPKKAARAEGGKKKGAAAAAAAASSAPPMLMPARPDDDDEEEDDEAALFTVMGAAKPNDDDDDADDATGAASATAPKAPAAAAAGVAKDKTTEFRTGSIMNRIDTGKFVMGTKLTKVVEHVQKTVPASEKVIVFSQFGAMLDLVEYSLERHGVRTVKLMGHMPLSQRQAMLRAFRNEPTVKCILISLKAGGEGLNLQCANHVVLMDPWWNPAVEMQAIQRAHRIGQRNVVKAVRFVTKDSVEERMMSLQDKKLLVFQGTIDGSTESLQRLSEEDLQFLFTR